MKMRRARILFLLILLSIVGGVLTIIFMPREPLLLKRATKITDTHVWENRWTAYQWINDREILFRGKQPLDPSLTWLAFFKWDTVTRQQTYLKGLTHLTQDAYNEKHSDMHISPDGKYLMWPTDEGSLIVATLQGQQTFGEQIFTLERGYGVRAAWMEDSAHLIEYAMDPFRDFIAYGTIFDVKTGKPNQHLSVVPDFMFEKVAMNNRLLARDRTGEDASQRVTDRLEIRESEIDRDQPAHKYTIHLPFKGEIVDEQFSSDGSHIVWSLVQKSGNLPPLYEWIHRRIPAFNPPHMSKISLWVSRIDGSQMHEIGYVPLRWDYNMDAPVQEDGIEFLSWTPNGQRLSFIYKDALYTVPANRLESQR